MTGVWRCRAARRRLWPGIAVAATLSLACAPAAQAGDGFKWRDLLTPLTDETDDWRVRTTFGGRTATFYGQVSMGALVHDDGVSTRAYAPVDNGNSGSRLGILWQLHPVFSQSLVLRFEAGITPNSTTSVSQLTGSSWSLDRDDVTLRKFELILDNFLYDGGTLTVGQGSMATDGIAEIDLSRTAVAAYSDVGPSAGGQFLRFENGVLSGVQIADVFDNYDGDRATGYNADGSRKLRMRYDTPEWRGFSLAAAFGFDVVEGGDGHADLALRYDQMRGDLRISGGIGYARKQDREVTSGSLSFEHQPTGLTFTTAAGHSSTGGTYGYAKIGAVREILAMGETAVSVDYYDGADVAGRNSRSRSFGLAVTQAIDARNVEMFALLRRYGYDSPGADYRKATSLLAGLRWKF